MEELSLNTHLNHANVLLTEQQQKSKSIEENYWEGAYFFIKPHQLQGQPFLISSSPPSIRNITDHNPEPTQLAGGDDFLWTSTWNESLLSQAYRGGLAVSVS